MSFESLQCSVCDAKLQYQHTSDHTGISCIAGGVAGLMIAVACLYAPPSASPPAILGLAISILTSVVVGCGVFATYSWIDQRQAAQRRSCPSCEEQAMKDTRWRLPGYGSWPHYSLWQCDCRTCTWVLEQNAPPLRLLAKTLILLTPVVILPLSVPFVYILSFLLPGWLSWLFFPVAWFAFFPFGSLLEGHTVLATICNGFLWGSVLLWLCTWVRRRKARKRSTELQETHGSHG